MTRIICFNNDVPGWRSAPYRESSLRCRALMPWGGSGLGAVIEAVFHLYHSIAGHHIPTAYSFLGMKADGPDRAPSGCWLIWREGRLQMGCCTIYPTRLLECRSRTLPWVGACGQSRLQLPACCQPTILQMDSGKCRTLRRRILHRASESGCCRRTSSTVPVAMASMSLP